MQNSPVSIYALRRDLGKMKEHLDLWVTNRDHYGRTALMHAINADFIPGVALLLPFERNIYLPSGESILDMPMTDELITLIKGYERGDARIIDELDSMATITTTTSGFCPLQAAVFGPSYWESQEASFLFRTKGTVTPKLCVNATRTFSARAFIYEVGVIPPPVLRTALYDLRNFSHLNLRPCTRIVYAEYSRYLVLDYGAPEAQAQTFQDLFELVKRSYQGQPATSTTDTILSDIELSSLCLQTLSLIQALFKTSAVFLIDWACLLHPCNVEYKDPGSYLFKTLPLVREFPRRLGTASGPSDLRMKKCWNSICLMLLDNMTAYALRDLARVVRGDSRTAIPDFPILSRILSSILQGRRQESLSPRRSMLSPSMMRSPVRQMRSHLSPHSSRMSVCSECTEADLVIDPTLPPIDINAEPLATDLMAAAYSGDLLGVAKAQNLIGQQDSMGHSALMYAAAGGHLAVVGLLLPYEWQLKDVDGNGPAEYAQLRSVRRRIERFKPGETELNDTIPSSSSSSSLPYS
ncbi:Ankyrin repeat protein 1 [Giardia muris]|uniref:Ankyrin repeat protein 1 n=1 Tax=Giardia muris TaxID=5742 RepID=A0A4Z1SYX7_GIAMU|nr:Ankyrin repeat protein 1 [Giardia muris]|eukprot:TNJ28698.1 Ankyrin repeat protein 1 [Giardia muris]